MVITRKPHILSKALAFIRYARAGKADTDLVSESYYTPQRIRHIGKILSSLLKHNSLEGCTQEDYEAFYIRYCGWHRVEMLVSMANWKSLIGVIAARVHFYTTNSLPLPSRNVLALKRLWKVVMALYRKE